MEVGTNEAHHNDQDGGAVVAMAAIATFAAPVALAAYPITGKLGSELTMTDTVGQVVPGWKGRDLKSSIAASPANPVAARSGQATATVGRFAARA